MQLTTVNREPLSHIVRTAKPLAKPQTSCDSPRAYFGRARMLISARVARSVSVGPPPRTARWRAVRPSLPLGFDRAVVDGDAPFGRDGVERDSRPAAA